MYDRVSNSMGSVMTLQFSVAAFAGMAAAMVVPSVRHTVPRWVEAPIWLGLIITSWLAITNAQQANTRYLTESAAWGADQIVNTSFGLMLAAFIAWMAEHRYVIANAVVTLAGADTLAVAIVWSYRRAQDGQPRIMLGDWFEVPLQRTPATDRVAVPYALDELNRRAERAAVKLGAAAVAWLVPIITARYRQAETNAHVVDIRALLSAQSIGWYGPIVLAPEGHGSIREYGENESDRLAS